MSSKEKEFLNQSDSNFEEILKSTSKLKVPPSKVGKEATWDIIMQSIDKNDKKEAKIVNISPRTIWISVAASLLVFFTITTLVYKYSTVQIQALKGSYANHILPDNSEVKLNADSQIEYREYGWINNREIKLSGEAFFSVKKGTRFTVITDFDRKIVVTGTKFNVFARGTQFEVKCFEGSVTVETPNTKNTALVKGEGLSVNSTTEQPTTIKLDSIEAPKWTVGEFYFNDRPLSLVFDELSRQFNITLNISGDISPEKRKYTGYFKKNSLTQALDLVCLPMGITYQISSDSTSVRIIR